MQCHLIYLPSQFGCFCNWELPPPECRGSRQACSAHCCGNEGVKMNSWTISFAIMNLIRKGLGQGKCCCYLTCSCKLGMNLPKPFLHKTNNDKKASQCVDRACQQQFWARRVLIFQLDQLQSLSFTGRAWTVRHHIPQRCLMQRCKTKGRGHSCSDSIKSLGSGSYILKQCLMEKDNDGSTFNSTVPP